MSIESHLLDQLGDSWEAATPGFLLQAYSGGKKIADLGVGETYKYYDLASLTKVLFSASSYMFELDEKSYRLTDPVSKWVSWFPKENSLQLKDLFSHTAGLTWWFPFYKSLEKKTADTPEEAWGEFEKILRKQVLKDLALAGLNADNSTKAVYSDLDLFLLGCALESITGQTLYENWQRARDRMGLSAIDFNRENKPQYKRSFYAPTENDKAWRGKVMQGEVHDENAWALKGVAPHAGLFGPIDDLSKFGLQLRRAIRGEKVRGFATPETVRRFTRRSIPRSRGDWGLGFMMPT